MNDLSTAQSSEAAATRTRFIHALVIVLAHVAAVAALAVVAKTQLSGDHETEAMWVVSFAAYPAFVAGEFCLLAAWIAWGGGHFSSRVALGAVAASLIYAVAAAVNSQGSWIRSYNPYQYSLHPYFDIWYLRELAGWYFSGALFMGAATACFLLLRFWGLRWLPPRETEQAMSRGAAKYQFRIRDLLILTAIAAAALGVGVRVFDKFSYSRQDITLWAALLAFATAGGVANVLLNAAPKKFWFASLLGWCGLIGMAWVALEYFRPEGSNSPTPWETKMLVLIVGVSFSLPIAVTLWTLRGLGYRAVWRP